MKRLITTLAVLLFLAGTATADVNHVRKPNNRTTEIMGDDGGRTAGSMKVIDACEATTGWTVLGNDASGIATDLDHVLGATSIEFDAVDGAANLTVKGIQKTITSVNLTWYVENGGTFGYSMNLSSLTDINYCFLRLGTDSSNYNEWQVLDSALSTGWNSVRFNADVPNSGASTGNGYNSAAVLWISIGCEFGVETDALADLRFDNINAKAGLQVSADINASVSSSSAAGDMNIAEIAGSPASAGSGVIGAGTLRATIATDDVVSTGAVVTAAWDDGDSRASVNPGKDYVLDLMNSTSGWAGANDASTGLALSANHVEGTNSLTFNKVDGTGFTEGYIQKTISSVDLITFEDHATIDFAIYASTLADVAYAFVRIGTDSSNYSEFRIDDDDLTAGVWNSVAIFGGDVEYAVVGTGAISSAITWIAVGASFDAENDTLAGIAVDNMKVHESTHTTTRLTSEVTTSVSTANVNMQKIGNQNTNMQGGNVQNGTQRVTIATDDVNQAAINAAVTALETDGDTYMLFHADLDDDATGNCVAITAGDVDFALPTAGDVYCVSTSGNTAFLLCGAAPAVDHTVGNFSFFVQEGATKCRILTGPNCAVIGVAAAGFICFEHLNSAL